MERYSHTLVSESSNTKVINYERKKIFLDDIKTKNAIMINAGSSAIKVQTGQLLGRISSGTNKGKVDIIDSSSSVGNQFPIGVLLNPVTIPAASEVKVAIVIETTINEAAIIYNSTDNKDTAVGSKLYEDRLSDIGIFTKNVIELTDFDNQ